MVTVPKSTSSLSPYIAPFRVDGGRRFHLKAHAAAETGDLNKNKAQKIVDANRKRLGDLQERLYAQDHWSILMIFQGMDAAGKDSVVKHVFDGINPQGCDVHSFKEPSSRELDHDFMWRAIKRLPERGRIGIFNRSYYEEVLVVRVHPDALASEKIPKRLVTKNIWRERFEDIAAFERYLSRNGTIVLKFFLNVSKEEQRKRFLDRLDQPAKHWKFSMHDVAERGLWTRYQAAYQDMIRHTSTPWAPWHVVPADHKWFTRLIVSSVLVETLDGLNLQFPRMDRASLQEFASVRAALENEKGPAARRKPSDKPPEKKGAVAPATISPQQD